MEALILASLMVDYILMMIFRYFDTVMCRSLDLAEFRRFSADFGRNRRKRRPKSAENDAELAEFSRFGGIRNKKKLSVFPGF